MSLRRHRLADEVRDLLAVCFQGGTLTDPRLEFVTITAVQISPDLQIASVFFRVFLDANSEDAQAGLRSAAGFLRRRLAEGLEIRRVPDLRFFFDESIERGARIEELIEDSKK